MNEEKKGRIVLKVEEGMDPESIYCTTYQMRNVYQQVATAYITAQEIMSLSMHQAAAFMARTNDKVLDVCCGRCMLLPLLRRHRPGILAYVGVDIWEPNMREATKNAAMSKIPGRLATNFPGTDEPYYPFQVHLIEADVSAMYDILAKPGLSPFDFIVYTASIEHMQKDCGEQSLIECYRMLRPGGRMMLTTPNTREKRDPYDTQYAAHLYEWSLDEIKEATKRIGFRVTNEFGLLAHATGYRDALEEEYPEYLELFDHLRSYLPSAWLYTMVPILTPRIADEVCLLLTRP